MTIYDDMSGLRFMPEPDHFHICSSIRNIYAYTLLREVIIYDVQSGKKWDII
jgi:hypothetical protein